MVIEWQVQTCMQALQHNDADEVDGGKKLNWMFAGGMMCARDKPDLLR